MGPYVKPLTPNFSGRVVVVTGAGRGNGLAISKGLSRMGAKVVGVDIEFQERRGPNDLLVDLGKLEDGAAIINSVISEHGRIDGLVNNAGISREFSPSKYDMNTFLEVFSVNLHSAILLAIETCKAMSKQPTGGSIVNITSLGAHMGFPQNPAYQISKAGLAALTRSLAKDWGIHGVRVNNIVPGYFRTAMTEDSFQDPVKRKSRETMSFLNRWGNSDELVGPVAFLISEMSSFVTGSDLFVDGGWSVNGGI